MKVYTEVIYRWDDDVNKLIEVSSQSYDYEGNVDLLQGTPTGQQDYAGLVGMQQEGGLGSYLQSEFGLGADYQKYLTPLQQKPFDIIQQQYGDTLGKLQMSTGQQIGTAMGQASQAASKSGFATSGTVNQALESQKNQLFESYNMDKRSATTDLESSIYGEQEKQLDKFYSDIGNVVRLKQSAEADSGGGCCFIILEVEEKNGLNKDVRRYRDEMMNDSNRSGYYKLAQVSVPLMRKSKLIKWFFKYSFVKPAKSWAKWHYHKKGIGWIFEPLRKFWLGLFTYLGKEYKLRVDNG